MLLKTKVLTLILFGLLFLNLSAQEDNFSNDPVAKLPDDNQKYRFGLQFNPNISWLKVNTSGYSASGNKFGFSYGLSFEYLMTKNYLFSTGLTVLNTKAKLVHHLINIPSIELIEEFELKYVEVPILLKLRTNEIGYLTYYGQFGFMAGFKFRDNSTTEYNSTSSFGFNITPTLEPSDVNEFNFFNLSLVIGGGIEYNISGNTTLMLGVTFSNGFIDQINKETSANLNYVALNFGIYF